MTKKDNPGGDMTPKSSSEIDLQNIQYLKLIEQGMQQILSPFSQSHQL